jgi:hypothetical protein
MSFSGSFLKRKGNRWRRKENGKEVFPCLNTWIPIFASKRIHSLVKYNCVPTASRSNLPVLYVLSSIRFRANDSRRTFLSLFQFLTSLFLFSYCSFSISSPPSSFAILFLSFSPFSTPSYSTFHRSASSFIMPLPLLFLPLQCPGLHNYAFRVWQDYGRKFNIGYNT